MKEILNVIHNTIYQFVCGDYKEVPMSDKDELLLQVNQAICNNLKALEQQPILDKIRAEIEQITDTMGVSYNQYVSKIDVLKIIDKYKAESEEV